MISSHLLLVWNQAATTVSLLPPTSATAAMQHRQVLLRSSSSAFFFSYHPARSRKPPCLDLQMCLSGSPHVSDWISTRFCLDLQMCLTGSPHVSDWISTRVCLDLHTFPAVLRPDPELLNHSISLLLRSTFSSSQNCLVRFSSANLGSKLMS